jgi:hypothetical protein
MNQIKKLSEKLYWESQAAFVPTGTIDNSPAIYRREQRA